MIIQGRDQTRIEHYLKRKFFIRPFVCSCCGDKIMLEHGYVVKDYFEPFDTQDKLCKICSKDAIEFIRKEKI